MASESVLNTFKQATRRGAGAPVVMLAMLAMLMLPLPPFVLDILFSFNIALSLVILLAVVYVLRPLEFAAFPTVVLLATLLRLALNIASSRVILLHGHDGAGAAGKVIEAFGEFVIGGNFAVGMVVFAILTIINFVVITKGATRVSEVTARRWRSTPISTPASSTRSRRVNAARKCARKRISTAPWTVLPNSCAAMRPPAS
jgi:flagellar biosynthesis protein FlhA